MFIQRPNGGEDTQVDPSGALRLGPGVEALPEGFHQDGSRQQRQQNW